MQTEPFSVLSVRPDEVEESVSLMGPLLSGPPIVQDSQVELAEDRWIDDQVDCEDFPRVMVKPNTTRGRPPGAQTAPTAPFTSAGCARRARPEKVPATVAAPRICPRGARIHGCAAGSEHDVWVEHRKKRARKTTKRSAGVAESNSRPPCGAGQQPVRPSPPRTAGSGGSLRRVLQRSRKWPAPSTQAASDPLAIGRQSRRGWRRQ